MANFRDPNKYVGKQFKVISSARSSKETVQVKVEDEWGNEMDFAFGNPAARQQDYTPGETREMSRTAQGGLVDYTWLSETKIHRSF